MYYKTINGLAEELMKWYIESFKTSYGEGNLVYTIHCLQHLPKQTLQNGPLDSHTAYPFENFMQILKKMVLRQTDVLPQVFRRLVETATNCKSVTADSNSQKYPEFSKSYQTNLPFGCTDVYKFLNLSNFKISINKPDNCCYLKDQIIIMIEYIAN